MRILAIDPGFDRMGIAVLEGDPSKPSLVWSDCVQPPKGAAAERLAAVKAAVEATIHKYSPDALALETLFFSTNVKTALGVAEARGAVLACAGALDPDAVTRQLRRAFAGNPDPEVAAHLGEVLWVHGDKEEARKIWQDSLRANPGNTPLQAVIKKFIP